MIEYLTKYRQEAERSQLSDIDFRWLHRWWFGEYDIEHGETGRTFSNAMDRLEGYYRLLTEKHNMLYAEVPVLQPPPAIEVKKGSDAGIKYPPAGKSSRYVMTVRYTFSYGQREYEGTWIEGRHSSHYLDDVKNLVVHYTLDAANLKEYEDSHFFGGGKTWQLPLFLIKIPFWFAMIHPIQRVP